MPTIFQMLEADHREILSVLEQITGDAGGRLDAEGRRLLLDRLIAAESRHEAAEELSFWPTAGRRLTDGRHLAEQGRRQEGDAKAVLDALRYEQDGSQLVEHIDALAVMIRSHISFEEEQVWPPLKRALGPIGSRLAGLKFRAAVKAAPTRPHPNGPDSAVGLATVGMAAAMGDRMRDRLSGRSRRLGPLTEGAPAATSGDAVDFLTGEHLRIGTLLHQVETGLAPGSEPAPEVVAQLIREVAGHDAIEREHLYPVARHRLDRGNEVYAAALQEHSDIAAALAEIDRRPEHDRLRRDDLERVVKLLRTHIAEEEGAVFPALRAHLSEQELVELGGRLEAARDKAPTRPHPHAAGAGLGARMSRMLVGPLDRTRDALSGRK